MKAISQKELGGLLKLMWPSQWIKNGFVLAPLVFSGLFTKPEAIANSVWAGMLFCLASSAAYIFNDIHDRDQDRKHPDKREKRPLASGLLEVSTAKRLLAAVVGLLCLGSFLLPSVLPVIAGYIGLNIAYTFKLKHQPVIDIFTIAIGFVLRVLAGVVALGVPASHWMMVTTLCLALYLAAVKRRQELLKSGPDSRLVLKTYSIALIERYAQMAAVGALFFYSMFVMEVRPEMVLTIPLVLFGIFRYWYIVEALGKGESPSEALFSDWQLAVTVVLWIGTVFYSIWP